MKLAEQNPTATIFLIMAFLIVMSYFAATYISGGASGQATGSAPVCGNGVREYPPETCDGGSAKCFVNDHGSYEGTMPCKSDCSGFNDAQCMSGQKCGDGKRNGLEEQCDGSDLGGATCKSLGFAGGTLSCNQAQMCSVNIETKTQECKSCQFDTTNCNDVVVCGNGIKEKGEECDGGDFGKNSPTCQEMGFYKGTMKCTKDCYYDTSSCSNCGNNQLDGDERCDGDKRQKVYNCCQTFQCSSTCSIAKAENCGNCGW